MPPQNVIKCKNWRGTQILKFRYANTFFFKTPHIQIRFLRRDPVYKYGLFQNTTYSNTTSGKRPGIQIWISGAFYLPLPPPPFRNFLEIHPFWKRRASLTHRLESLIKSDFVIVTTRNFDCGRLCIVGKEIVSSALLLATRRYFLVVGMFIFNLWDGTTPFFVWFICTFAKDSTGEHCDTVDGPQAHLPCIFPFNFQGVAHNACTTIDGDRAW